MTPADARRIIASYLAGRRVEAGELAMARRALAEARVDLAPLHVELGLTADASDCEQFSANVADFCQMSATERREEAPELVRHAEECTACRQLLWRVKPPWMDRVGETLGAGATAVARALAEPIRIALGVAELHERGIGPPALVFHQVAATAAAAVEESDARKEWVLADEEAGRVLRLRVAWGPAREALVTLSIEPPEGEGRLEVRRQDGSLLLSGPLDDLQVEPVRLGPGTWSLRVSLSGPDRRAWEIPLDIADETPDGKAQP
jgi:hypothetical protein